MKRRLCLLSVSDKTGLEALATALVAANYEILSTGGTARALAAAGIRYLSVSDFTGFPEIFDGRVKTLHPRIHGGILGRRGQDEAIAAAIGITWIDLVVVNLYPFAETLKKGAGYEEAVEQIDIGGPAMVRAAAKNHADVTVVVEPADYPELIEQLPQPDREFRKKMAARAFRHTALYDATIAGWFFKETKEVGLLEKMALPLAQVQPLRYGENPHQKAAFYRVAGEEGRSLANAQQLQGKELSYNNLADADAAVRCVFELKGPGAVIIKHANPCGAGLHPEGLTKAFTLALSGDPVSAYGGILAFNRKLETDAAMAVLESKVFFEVIAAPGISEEAAALFASKKNLRLISLPEDWQSQKAEGFDGKRVSGGWLLQSWDEPQSIPWKAVLKEATPEELETLQFAWTLCRNVKSNAIVLAKAEGGGFVLNGVGAGQMSRVDSVRLAISKATRPIPGSCLASDAFFPFADGVVVALEAGVRAFVQPGGSIRDAEVLEAARAKDATMYFTDTRHFRH